MRQGTGDDEKRLSYGGSDHDANTNVHPQNLSGVNYA
jgi:hypothetical protein